MSNYKVIVTEWDGFRNDCGNMGSLPNARSYAEALYDEPETKSVEVLMEKGEQWVNLLTWG